jgi:ferric-dicitrate binding protein FerR (iron transport regulator)
MKRDKKVSFRGITGFLGLAALVCGVLLLAPILRAEDDNTTNAAPARAVRLSSVDGEVHLYQGSEQVADQAVANTPLFEGARIETGNDGRAEIQFEDGSVARLSPQSSVTVSVLRGVSNGSDREAEMLLNGGLGYFEIQGDGDSNHMRVRFGDTVVTAGGFTVIRVNLDKAPGEVAVFSGNAHIEGGASPTLDLHGGESVVLNATDPNSYNLAETIEPDSWDAWNSDRDQELTTAQAGRTPATDNQPDNRNPAWSDLDANGNWYNVPDQGYVWSPYDASNPGWDPYGNGYWMNSPNYGYMWISGEPWGFMPYQCGAWNYYSSFGWGWAPGGFCNPWWGGGGGWGINIGIAPPRYRYPVRPRPRNPRPMGGHDNPQPLIAVNRRVAPGNTMLAPRDKTGSVLIAGSVVRPLKPIQARPPYNHPGPVFGTRPVSGTQPSPGNNPRIGFQGGSTPRAIDVPARPGNVYTPPPQTRPGATYTPQPVVRPNGGSYTPPPTHYSPPPAPVRSSPPPSAPVRSSPPPSAPSHPSGGGGGGGGGGHPAAGPHR